MGLVDKRQPEEHCFLGLDQDPENPTSWKLSTRDYRFQESTSVAQKIGLILAHQFGPMVWSAWFTPEYKLNQEAQFHYDPSEGRYVSKTQNIFSRLRKSDYFQSRYEAEMTDTNQKHCIIDNLAIKLPGSFRTKSIHNPSGDQSATTIPNGAEILSTIYDVEAMEEDDWSDLDEEQGPATAMEANQQASQSAAAFSPKHTTPPQSTEDTEMEVDTDIPMVLRSLKEEFLRMEIEDPPENSLKDYPASLEAFKSSFTIWYRHRKSEKDHMPTAKHRQLKAIYFVTVCVSCWTMRSSSRTGPTCPTLMFFMS
jgi:hypothetical protein